MIDNSWIIVGTIDGDMCFSKLNRSIMTFVWVGSLADADHYGDRYIAEVTKDDLVEKFSKETESLHIRKVSDIRLRRMTDFNL